MKQRILLTGDGVPRLAPHMRLRHDAVRGVWTVQAPERSFMLDEIAHTVISRCDGKASLDEIIAGLCADFPGAPRADIERDVIALLQDLADKGVITT